MGAAKVVVFFFLINGGSVQVDRTFDLQEPLEDEVCTIMAYDVMNELAGAKPPRIDMAQVKYIRYNCGWWVV